MAVVSLVGAVALGVVAGILETRWMFAFVAFGGFIVVFYNLGLWHNRFHTDLWFAFSWGAFPVLTSYLVNASRLDVAVVLLAVGCFFLTLAQRTLSTPVRTIRRKALHVEGYRGMTVVDERVTRRRDPANVEVAYSIDADRAMSLVVDSVRN